MILTALLALTLAAEPKAVVTGPKSVPLGSVVFLDASLSQSDRPIKWRSLGAPNQIIPLDKDDRKGAYAILPALGPGTHRFVAVAVGTPDKATEPDADFAFVEVTVVEAPAPKPDPQPTPPPAPTPQPSPVPTDPFGRLAYSYGQAVTLSYAETLEESASMLAAGVSRAAITADFDKRWKARRDQAFKAIAAEYAQIAPDDREPNADEKAKLAQAWKDFAKGMRAR